MSETGFRPLEGDYNKENKKTRPGKRRIFFSEKIFTPVFGAAQNKRNLHHSGIEPEAPAWQAEILPLNQ